MALRLKLDGTGNLLDIGCGPGTLTIPLSKFFDSVLAVDVDPEMINCGQGTTSNLGIKNVQWLTKNGQDLDADIGTFKVMTFGNSLHWFNIKRILKFSFSILEPFGAVVDIGASSIWRHAPEVWQQKTLEIIKHYLGEQRRTIEGLYKSPPKKYSEYIKDAGFNNIQTWDINFTKRILNADDVVKAQFSMSYASRELLGNNVDNFAKDLKSVLLKLNPDNRFEDRTAGSITIGWKI